MRSRTSRLLSVVLVCTTLFTTSGSFATETYDYIESIDNSVDLELKNQDIEFEEEFEPDIEDEEIETEIEEVEVEDLVVEPAIEEVEEEETVEEIGEEKIEETSDEVDFLSEDSDIFTEETALNDFRNSSELMKRIFGSNRISTSVEISKFLRAKSDLVILADSRNYADALSGSSLTDGKYPMLLVDRLVSDLVLDEIKRLGASKVIILGGPVAVSSQVEEQLTGIGIENISRIAGKDRYETSYKIVKEDKKSNILFTSGSNFPDALASASFAHHTNSNLVLMGKDFSPSNQELKSQSDRTWVIGGNTAINSNLIPGEKTIIAGSDRYETSTLLAEEMKQDFIIVTSGEDFPDALSVSSLAIGLNAPVILTASKSLPKKTIDFLAKNRGNIKKILVIGGEKAIEPIVYKNIEEIVKTGAIQTKPVDLSLFKNNKYVMAVRNTKLSEKIDIPAGKIAKVLSIKGETVELQYNGFNGTAILEDYGVNTIADKNFELAYISQLSPVYAPVGCEPIALLTGLKGKGYAEDIGIREFLDNLPRHESNPRKGYVGSPYESSETLRTTINPEPLANYGATYGDVASIEGASIDDIIMELDNDNPVVVYVTLFWKPAYYRDFIIEGKTESWLRNNHAILLTGYDKNTKEFYLSDPYNRKSGSSYEYPNYQYKKSRSILEPLYNIRKFGVVVR